MTELQARLFEPIILTHALAASAAVVVGASIFLRRKGTRMHRAVGRIWVAAMALTALSSFAIPARILGLDTPAGRFGPIHLLSVLTLVTLVSAIAAIRHGRQTAHQSAMLSLYVSLLIAGAFTLLPSRILGAWLRTLLG
jgi:uncharacterized membrane protein